MRTKLPDLQKSSSHSPIGDAAFFKNIVLLTALLAGIILPLYAIKVGYKADYSDFTVYYRTAERVKNHLWSDLYSLKDGTSPFRYAPPFLLFFRPLAELSLTQARLVWYFFQYLSFALGFYWLYRGILLSTKSRLRASGLTCLSAIYIIRFCLDTFTIGQVSSFMFLGFAGGFYAWSSGKPALAALGIAIPTLFKIGPGFLYGVYLSARPRDRWRGGAMAILAAAIPSLIFFLWAGQELAQNLLQGWIRIVALDSVYYDASHYGSQSLKSFLLRLAKSQYLSLENAQFFYGLLSLTIIFSTAAFWLFRRPTSTRGRGLFYSLGIFVCAWVMPETFKYSLTPLAIPVALLFSFIFKESPDEDEDQNEKRNGKARENFSLIALGSGVLFLTLPGKDIVGDLIFFGLQEYSAPLFATILLGIATFLYAWRESTLEYRFLVTAASCFKWLFKKDVKIGPWNSLPSLERSCDVSLIIPLEIRQWTNPSREIKVIHEEIMTRYRMLEKYTGNQNKTKTFEILLVFHAPDEAVPAKIPTPELDSLVKGLSEILSHDKIRPLPNQTSPQIYPHCAAALQAGFLVSIGKKLLISRLALTFNQGQNKEVLFLKESLSLLDEGYDLVREIRQTVRKDTGTLAFSWRLGVHAFAVRTSAHSFFDLELSSLAQARGYRERRLPELLRLSRPFIMRVKDSVQSLRGYLELAERRTQGCFRALPPVTQITADDWGLSPGVNEGILRLAQAGVVRRISMMANTPYLTHGLRELTTIPGIKLGLHFNLTYGRPTQNHPLKYFGLIEAGESGKGNNTFIPSPARFLFRWLWASWGRTGLAARQFVQEELKSQMNSVQNHGVQLTYVDGHHHIHLVPGLIDTLAPLLKSAGIRHLRIPYDPALWFSARAPFLILSLFARFRLRKHGFIYSPCFYPQPIHFQDQGLLRAKLAENPDAEIIVHPASKNDLDLLEFPDPYTDGRVTEFQALQILGFNL